MTDKEWNKMTAPEKAIELMERIGSEVMLNDLIHWLDNDTLNKACDDIATDFDVVEYEDDSKENLLPPAEYIKILVKMFANSAFTGKPSTYWAYLLDQTEKHVAIQNKVMEGKSIEEVSPFPILRFHVATGEVATEWIEWADDMFLDDTDEAYTIWPHNPNDPHEYALEILVEYEDRFIF